MAGVGRGLRGGSRDLVLRDPNVERGRYKVLPRADGGFVVFDTTAPIGHGVASKKVPTVADATQLAEDLDAIDIAKAKAAHGDALPAPTSTPKLGP